MQLFVPCILMGCSFGRFYGELMKWYIFPGAGIAPGTYALMGAVGMLGGVARMTISLTVILMETTQNLQFLLPIMMILLVGKWVGDTFNISLYDLHVEIQCMPFVEASPPLGMENMVAVQVASGVIRSGEAPTGGHGSVSHVKCIRKSTTTMRDLLHLVQSNSHSGFPVLEDLENDATGERMVGFVLRNTIVTVVSRILRGGLDQDPIMAKDFTTSLNSKRVLLPVQNKLNGLVAAFGADKTVDMGPYIDRSTLTVQTGFPMSKVYTLFRALGLRHLVVVDRLGRPAGIITRKELMCAFDRDLM